MDINIKKYCSNSIGGPELHLNENKSVFILQTSLIINTSFPLNCMWDLWETKLWFALFSDCSPKIWTGLLFSGYIPMWLFHSAKKRQTVLTQRGFNIPAQMSWHQQVWRKQTPEMVGQRRLQTSQKPRPLCSVVQGYSWDNYAKMTLQYSFTHTHPNKPVLKILRGAVEL